MKTNSWIRSVTPAIFVVTALWMPADSLQTVQQPAEKTAPQAVAKITIDNFKFGPATLEIAAGTKVTWTNQDDVPHIVASVTKKLFVSPTLDTDDTFSFTFKDPGTYEYYCSVHPHMTGKVVVK